MRNKLAAWLLVIIHELLMPWETLGEKEWLSIILTHYLTLVLILVLALRWGIFLILEINIWRDLIM